MNNIYDNFALSGLRKENICYVGRCPTLYNIRLSAF